MYDNYRGRDEKEREKAASVLVPVAVGLTSGAFRLALLSISNQDNYLPLLKIVNTFPHTFPCKKN